MESSAGGLDGIPFEAYGGVRELATDLVLAIAESMFDGRAQIPADFNWAILVCIGRSSSEALDTSEPIFNAENTRPISIVDASNRLLASVFRVILERCVAQKMSHM